MQRGLLFVLGLALAGPSNNAFAKAERIRVAVLDFTADKPEMAWLTSGGTTAFSEVLTKLKRYQVVERGALEKILKEQSLSTTGMVDDKTAVKIGKLAGVEHIVLGQVGQGVITRETINVPVQAPGGGVSMTFDGKVNHIVTREKWKVKGKLAVTYRFVNVETGEISTQGSHVHEFSEQYEISAAGANAVATPTVAGETESMKMMKMMLEHQEEMERIKAGLPAKSKDAAPTATPPPTLWTSYQELAEKGVRLSIGSFEYDLYNAFPVTGEIVEIQDAKGRRCVIDVGGSIGVKKGDDFDFLDGKGLAIGDMEVKEVGETSSIAKYQKDERVVAGVKIRAKPRKGGFFGF